MVHSFGSRPATRLGWWAVGLGAAFVLQYAGVVAAMGLRFSLPPTFAVLMLLCGLGAGLLGLTAVIRNRERSWMVWLTLLPGALVLFLLMGELLFPH